MRFKLFALQPAGLIWADASGIKFIPDMAMLSTAKTPPDVIILFAIFIDLKSSLAIPNCFFVKYILIVQLEVLISKVKFEDMELLLYKTLTVDLKKFDLLVLLGRKIGKSG